MLSIHDDSFESALNRLAQWSGRSSLELTGGEDSANNLSLFMCFCKTAEYSCMVCFYDTFMVFLSPFWWQNTVSMSCVGICVLICQSLPYCKKACVIRLLTLVICNGLKYLETCTLFPITRHMPRSGDYTECAHVLVCVSSVLLKSAVQFSPLIRRSPLQCVLTLQHQVDILIFHLGTAFPTILLLHDLLTAPSRLSQSQQ